MDNDDRRRKSPSEMDANCMTTPLVPGPLVGNATEMGLDQATLNSHFPAGPYTQPTVDSSFPYHPSFPDPSAPSQTFSQPHTAQSFGFAAVDPGATTFPADPQLAFPDTHSFHDQYLSSNKALILPEETLNRSTDFAYANFDMAAASLEPTHQPNVNPANLSKIPSSHTSTPPRLFSSDGHPSPAQPASPASTHGQFYTPQHSRHHSLDPASAAYPAGAAPMDWQGLSFQQHTRDISDHSDVSSTSASPYLAHTELHDAADNQASPLMGPQQDGSSAFGIENFSITEQQQAYISPGRTPYISPRLMPQQQPASALQADASLAASIGMSDSGPELYATPPDGSFGRAASSHVRHTSGMSDMGQADQLPAPTINIEPCPVSRQTSFEVEMDQLGDSLSPPTRPRGRSKSDPHVSRAASRPVSASATSDRRAHTPSFTRHDSGDRFSRSLSPGSGPLSRESSPGASSGRIEKSRRQSTSSISTREYFLGLADPNRPTGSSPSGSTSRGQKHPATYQCKLCTKRFTRAYNLRSHNRTHTDERPFVCTVCGKAFARQHDRKRHEGLHSGEKKFVCKGGLGSGRNWGCGRKFARADALGRHFRSEAGRMCIKPLLDEEAVERERNALLQQQQQQQHLDQPANLMAGSVPAGRQQQQQQMINVDSSGGFTLPAALLAQYPALNNIDWASIPQGDETGDLSDVGASGTALDASSGGEMGFDDSDVGDRDGRSSPMWYGGEVGKGR